MKIYSVYDKEFREYGEVLNDNFPDILEVLKDAPINNEGTLYVPNDPKFESLKSYELIKNKYYGDMPIQIGYCNGYNNKLNCLEYHKDSEINYSFEEFILLLGRRQDIIDGKYDTKNVVAFKVPANVAVEVYATTLHYAPIRENNLPFKVLVVLPKGTNTKAAKSESDKLLRMTNKWLLAHKDTKEAKNGAYIGLIGDNIKVE